VIHFLTGLVFFQHAFHQGDIVFCKAFYDEHYRKIECDSNKDYEKDVQVMEEVDECAHESTGDDWFDNDFMEWEEMEIPSREV